MSHIRWRILFWLIVMTAIGFGMKFYTGPAQGWVNNSLSGAAYEIFWILAALLIWPRPEAVKWIAAAVFDITCVLEILQLWRPPLLEAIRSTFIGRTLIGNSFQWSDFPYYAVGCVIGFLLAKALVRHAQPTGHDRNATNIFNEPRA